MPAQAYKRCSRCREHKALSEFNRQSAAKDGRQNYCKDCRRGWRLDNDDRVKAVDQKYRETHREQERARGMRWYFEHRERAKLNNERWAAANPERAKEGEIRRRKRYPHKAKARWDVGNALRDGRLVKPDACEDCGEQVGPQRLEGHHEDYSKPLDVEWLCKRCHLKRK